MKKLIIILFVLNVSAAFAQKKYVPDEIDYLAYNYKYLDSNYAIDIDAIEFNETATKYGFIKERITNYQDSLGVVLMNEFGDWKKQRLAKSKITYKWERVGYHLWKKEDEIKQLGQEFGVIHPYRLQQLFYAPNGNEKAIEIMDDLRNKLITKFDADTLKGLENYYLMKFAFNNNPDVLLLKAEYFHKINIKKFKTEHGRLPNSEEKKKYSLECVTENCCQ